MNVNKKNLPKLSWREKIVFSTDTFCLKNGDTMEIEVEENTTQKSKNENMFCPYKLFNISENFEKKPMHIGKAKSIVERKWFAEREREKGNDLFKAKEYNASIATYNLAIELFPRSPLAFGNRAASNIKMKKWENAIKDCCTALELDRNYMKAYIRRGLANFKLQHYQEAMIDFCKALEFDPQNQDALQLIHRTKHKLESLKSKQESEFLFEEGKKHAIMLQGGKEESIMLQNMSNSSILSNTCMRMKIQAVDDSIINNL
ncbi:hypothetical protein KC19_VG261400 [Ceratodon purpureus]|uniref:Uncharacterized protein n=1 Tax=Ceratodon purpureus TaxID=3225 RepID=A0A8T0HVD3_CERPU|nr:hypothetical protein KC19_VG261400 [Ceratodon purpureus]KAG0574419.1 hypothetical protein KC19_VG261400 [Ceratodon purpureus]